MSASDRVRRARPLLGTFVEIETDGSRDLLERAFAVMGRVEGLMSFHRADSDVARINAHAAEAPVEVDARTFAVLAKAHLLWEGSEGSFDVTREGMFQALTLAGSREVRAACPVTVDLGGIAKGWAVDEAIVVLSEGGASFAVVNAGGDLRVWGETAVEVSLRDPDSGRPTSAFRLQSAALATTARYQPWSGRRPEDGVRCGGRVAERAALRSVSVRAPHCWQADALTKIAWIHGQQAEPMLAAFEAEALWLRADGSTAQTGGWA